MSITDNDIRYMRRALQLAAATPYDTHPNPMVGAVIVADGQIIGEGYHRRCGDGHAEVNAVDSVHDCDSLRRATIYVTLEPCSHYGKTPPCAELIIRSGIPRVVIAASDPFDKVAGRGITMLRQAGIEVEIGVLAEESRRLNRRFITAHTLHRPYVTLKWAMSADGFMDHKRLPGQPAARFSTPMTQMLVHRERSIHDAILTTAATVIADSPRMDVRLWSGPSPRKVIVDRHGLPSTDAVIFSQCGQKPLLYAPAPLPSAEIEHVQCGNDLTIETLLTDLYHRGITSVLVESGPRMLGSFITSGCWDRVRIERSPVILGTQGTAAAPDIAGKFSSIHTSVYGTSTITTAER